MDDSEKMRTNRRRWNELADLHSRSSYYDLESFKKGRSSLLPMERNELGDIRDKKVLHLQCHIGLDSISMAREGAKVTGVDFSEKAMEIAKELAEELDIETNFITANIYDLPDILEERFDIVFASYGVLCWIPDLTRWFEVAKKMLVPGGFVYLVDGHPFADTLDNDSSDLVCVYPYFNLSALMSDEEESYSGEKVKNSKSFEWNHSVQEILEAVIDNGLHLDHLHEFPYGFWKRVKDLEKGEDGLWRFPDERSFPLTMSIKATLPC